MTINEPFVITISREVGSGGRTVGRMLATKLNVRYSDKDLIRKLRTQFGLSTAAIEKLKAEKKNWLGDFLRLVSPVPTATALLDKDANSLREYRDDVTTEDVYRAELEILQELASEGSLVVAGRSGFFALKNFPNRLDVMITAPRDTRVQRIMQKQNLTREEAKAVVGQVDKARENYVHRFTGTSRYDLRNYHLVLNAEGHTEEELAQVILSYIGL